MLVLSFWIHIKGKNPSNAEGKAQLILAQSYAKGTRELAWLFTVQQDIFGQDISMQSVRSKAARSCISLKKQQPFSIPEVQREPATYLWNVEVCLLEQLTNDENVGGCPITCDVILRCGDFGYQGGSRMLDLLGEEWDTTIIPHPSRECCMSSPAKQQTQPSPRRFSGT